MPGSADLIEGFKALDGAAEEYRTAWRYAYGDLPERFANQVIQRLVEGTDAPSRYRFRLARKPITALTSRISISSVTSSRGDAVNRAIEDIRQANDLELYEPFIHERTLIFGNGYAFVWPVQPNEDTESRDGEQVDAPADADVRAVGVEISYQSPLSCRAMYDAEDGRRLRYVIRRWREARPLGKQWRAEVWYPDGRMESWITNPDASGTDPNDWHPYAEDDQGNEIPATTDNWPIRHDYGCPIKHARTALPYGIPAHADAYGPQDAITKATMTQVVGDIEAHGWPERARIMDDAKILEGGRDSVPWDDDASAPPASAAGIQPSARRRGGGLETDYYGTRDIKEFTPPDPGQLIQPMDQWVRFLSVATDVPLYEFDPSTGQQMSGVARWRAEAPLRALERRVKAYFLRFWRDVWDAALRMYGISDPGTITINWSPPEVVSDPEWWATAQIRRALGVPDRKILEEANYPPSEVEEWLSEHGEDDTLDRQIQRLQSLADALQSMGTAVSLGAVDEATAATLINRILGEAGVPPTTVELPPPAPVVQVAPPGEQVPAE
ncbi:MAG TPA: hypothetical protein VFU47_12870 [Armatimonadota bacterium]|nr:hypothetical protein [Armatimonadota bacterium]